jgi:hypothetical protein
MYEEAVQVCLDGMKPDSDGFSPPRQRITAFAGVAQCDGNGLLDRLFLSADDWCLSTHPYFQSSTSVLILLLTTDWLDPFLRGMIFLLSPESIEHGFHETRRGNRMFLSACAMFCSLVDRI